MQLSCSICQKRRSVFSISQQWGLPQRSSLLLEPGGTYHKANDRTTVLWQKYFLHMVLLLLKSLASFSADRNKTEVPALLLPKGGRTWPELLFKHLCLFCASTNLSNGKVLVIYPLYHSPIFFLKGTSTSEKS